MGGGSSVCDPYSSGCQCSKQCPDGYLGDNWTTIASTKNYRTIYNNNSTQARYGVYYLRSEVCSLSKSCVGYASSTVAGGYNSCGSPFYLSGNYCVYDGT
mgnify:CR=1 FL=1